MPPPNQPPAAPKLCPLLTMASLSNRKQNMITVPGQNQGGEMEAISCQGPSCAWFMPITDEKGALVGGNCSVNLLALGVNGAQNMIGGALQKAGFLPKDPNDKPH